MCLRLHFTHCIPLIPVFLMFIVINTNKSEFIYSFEPPNLRTVLFKMTDLTPSRCWSPDEVSLLVSRRVVQDLIPRKVPQDIPLLLKYLKNLEATLNLFPVDINRTMVTLAVADVIGSYLQSIVIPIAKEAYYAGNVDYNTVSELHDMLVKWKWHLNTDGGTWSQECDMRKIPTKVTVLEVDLQDTEAACQELYVSPRVSNETDTLGSETVIAEMSRVAIPYFDNNAMPNAIALPFKKRNLYSLFDPRAAYVLVKYYNLTMRCLSGDTSDVLAFNNFFHQWIVSKVVTHLHDQNCWYPAFGAVMRVMETIKQKGLASVNPIFVQPLGDEHQDAALDINLEVAGSKHNSIFANFSHVVSNSYATLTFLLLLLALLASLICWLCAFSCWKCWQKRKKTVFYTADCPNNILQNVLISICSRIKDSASGSRSKLESNNTKTKNLYENQMESKDSSTQVLYKNTPLSLTTSDDDASDDSFYP